MWPALLQLFFESTLSADLARNENKPGVHDYRRSALGAPP